MLKIQNNDNHKTNKGKYDKHLTPSLFSLVLVLLLIVSFSMCVYREERGHDRRKLKKKEAAAVAATATRRRTRNGAVRDRDDLRKASAEKRYDDRTMFFTCHPSNILSFAFSICRRRRRPRRKIRRRRRRRRRRRWRQELPTTPQRQGARGMFCAFSPANICPLLLVFAE